MSHQTYALLLVFKAEHEGSDLILRKVVGVIGDDLDA
jgi:hypothetical protein